MDAPEPAERASLTKFGGPRAGGSCDSHPMHEGDRETKASVITPSLEPTAAPATVAACHPDLVCPVCTARGKTVRMHPVKAHYQCPDCHYFDSCCM
jgi:hypothetical protein